MNLTNIQESQQHNTFPNPVNMQNWSQVTPQYMPWGHTPQCPPAPLVTFTATSIPQPIVQPQPIPQPQPMPTPAFFNQQNIPWHQQTPTGSFRKDNLLSHCKRKAEHDISFPTKQHITEERMAAHMSRLHISSETEYVPPSTSPEEEARNREQRLYVCEEMRRLQTESILPSALLGRLERPCMAVMLWQPPPKIPGLMSSQPSLNEAVASVAQAWQQQAGNNSREDDTDNNNSSTVDLNNMDMDG